MGLYERLYGGAREFRDIYVAHGLPEDFQHLNLDIGIASASEAK